MGELVMTEIDGGYCVKRLDDQHCVDLMKMLFNWRIVVTPRTADGPHQVCVAAWCYFGHGVDAQGRPRTMHQAFLAALAAIDVWDGTGEPPGYDERAL